MADDRPVDDPAAEIGRLSAELADLKSTLVVQLSRRPVGDFEAYLGSSPKPGTLVCDGQTVSRTTYAALWQWVQDHGRVVAGLFTNGDGSTTFGLPDFRGKVLRGVDTGEAVGQVVGADTKAITTSNLPGHTHAMGGTTSSDSHSHSGSSNSAGGHGGHSSGSSNVTQPGSGIVLPGNYNATGGAHSHSFSLSSDAHSHTLSGTSGSTGSGTVFDVRQEGVAVLPLVWY